jgi:hypothetical protein
MFYKGHGFFHLTNIKFLSSNKNVSLKALFFYNEPMDRLIKKIQKNEVSEPLLIIYNICIKGSSFQLKNQQSRRS